ncbi:MAG: Fic family protein [Actinobacteria bacterium]|nr:Fic family protein [Actinomycetota bacterium]
MPSFLESRINEIKLPLSTSWLLASCMEARGKQDLWIRQKPEVLKALRDQAVIQSVESSNRIEGVTVDAKRLRPLVFGSARPQDRPEEEIAGYRKALEWIFTARRRIEVTPDVILKMHRLAQGGMISDAGRWKSRDNEIVELKPNGERVIRFTPTSAKKTPAAVEALCRDYRDGVSSGVLPELLLIASFVLDFLCVHPFRDGNGRVSRLMTALLLENSGFVVARYISLERLVEESRESYYQALYHSSVGWHESSHDIIPWLDFFLSIINRAYREFSDAVEAGNAGPGKTELARMVILETDGQFSLSEIHAKLPGVSEQLVKRVLQQMKADGRLKLSGKGRGARWEKV